ncbi:hypothetical protein AVEN_131115-1 [Araneus ventricosus]|uniref:Uncharacterized protein n=1 Tax=Araneus ventricosus TaxID=182803 RepID=A0A4Y2GH98_ARAVE|nr:hypothetical protein AVEN_131115-1 [Araneus ventricosus]
MWDSVQRTKCPQKMLPIRGWLNDFLSYKYFAPIARLSFSCNMINMIVIERYFLTLEQPIEYSAVSLALLTMYLLFWTFAASFIVAVFFEIPVSKLIGLLSKKHKE